MKRRRRGHTTSGGVGVHRERRDVAAAAGPSGGPVVVRRCAAGVPLPGQGERDIRGERGRRRARRQLRHTVPAGLQPDRHRVGLRQEAVHSARQTPRPDTVPDREVFAHHVRLRHTRHAGRRLRDGVEVQRGVLHEQRPEGTRLVVPPPRGRSFERERHHQNVVVLSCIILIIVDDDACFQVFDVVLNGQHVVVPQLDIYDKVGFGSAHDEYIEFTVDGTTLYWRGEISEIKGNLVRVDFIKVCTQ